jgi:undecaprenyl-diphosphatase
VSSTGHLILANHYFGIEGAFGNLFAVVIQSGAILAVILYFKDRFFPKSFSKEDLKSYAVFWSKIVVAIAPAGMIGIPFEDTIDAYLFKAVVVAYALIGGAFLILAVERKDRPVRITSDLQITYKSAFLIGLAQCLSMIPGMSRSASTIIGGLLLGFSRALAAEMSFFMAVPTLLGAGLIKMLKAGFALTSTQWIVLGVGTLVSFIVAYGVIALFMNFIKKHNFKVFAYYRIILGAVILFSLYAL